MSQPLPRKQSKTICLDSRKGPLNQPTKVSVENKPNRAMIELLTPIWQRLLETSPINAEDNFFDLGGDSFLAVELFNTIAKECNRELSPVTIYQAPTIAALAAVLEAPTTPRLPSLVPLKPGAGQPAVFFGHGLGGSAMDFFQLVRHIQSPRPMYGIQARGTDGADEPFERIEDMAKFHLDAIREVQAHGPYIFVGFSFGGLVMLEMARLLVETGENVALLALLETYPHIRFVPIVQRVRLLMRLTKHHLFTAMQMRLPDALSYLFRPSARLAHFSRNIGGHKKNRPAISLWFTPAMQRVRGGAYRALKRYRPHPYGGKIRFVAAQTPTEFPDDPIAVWAGLASSFEVETVPGDHLGILTTHFENLGAILSRYLQEVISQD